MTDWENEHSHTAEPGVWARLGVPVYGLGAIALAILGFVSGDFAGVWQPVPAHIPAREALAYATACCLFFGGIAIQTRRFAQIGAIVLGFLYLVFGALWLPRVIAYPQIFGTWGGVFEQLSLVAAAMVIYASCVEHDQEAETEPEIGQAGRILYGVCAVVFGLNHFFAIPETAAMVPKWIPPGPYFWAVGTGVAHLLAGISILSGILARIASRLLTSMLLLFGVLVWLPSLLGHTQEHMVWSGNAINLVMAGAAWVIADWIAAGRAVGAKAKSFRAVSA